MDREVGEVVGTEIPIDNPLVLADQFLLERHPLIPRRLNKAWLPKELIQFDDRQSRDLTELPGEGRLARSSGTKDHCTLHGA